MTIHSDWARVLHEECPAAFARTLPRGLAPRVGIIDGHLQLMRLDGRVASWDAFVHGQFVRPARMLFDEGCPVVVVCFDCYDHVPAYKSITQRLRAGRHEVKVFHAHQALPETIPDDAMLYLMNRAFKLKVIDLVCRRLPAALGVREGQQLVIDYRRVVAYEPGCPTPTPVEGLAPMGESDVKFCRYVRRFGTALVHAIDGDYLPIALLYYARHGAHPGERIFILRHLAVLERQAEPGQAATTKRARAPRAPLCWADTQTLYHVVAAALRGSLPGVPLHPATGAPHPDAVFVRAAVFLMLLAGTDFSRGLPQLGPRRTWDALHLVCLPLLQSAAAEPPFADLAPARTAVARLYAAVFEKHAGGARRLEAVLEALQGSKLSARTRAALPGALRVDATLRNVRWLTRYWEQENGEVDTPLDGENGFVRTAAGEGAAVCFADDPPGPA